MTAYMEKQVLKKHWPDDPEGLAWALTWLADTDIATESYERARERLEKALAIRHG